MAEPDIFKNSSMIARTYTTGAKPDNATTSACSQSHSARKRHPTSKATEALQEQKSANYAHLHATNSRKRKSTHPVSSFSGINRSPTSLKNAFAIHIRERKNTESAAHGLKSLPIIEPAQLELEIHGTQQATNEEFSAVLTQVDNSTIIPGSSSHNYFAAQEQSKQAGKKLITNKMKSRFTNAHSPFIAQESKSVELHLSSRSENEVSPAEVPESEIGVLKRKLTTEPGGPVQKKSPSSSEDERPLAKKAKLGLKVSNSMLTDEQRESLLEKWSRRSNDQNTPAKKKKKTSSPEDIFSSADQAVSQDSGTITQTSVPPSQSSDNTSPPVVPTPRKQLQATPKSKKKSRTKKRQPAAAPAPVDWKNPATISGLYTDPTTGKTAWVEPPVVNKTAFALAGMKRDSWGSIFRTMQPFGKGPFKSVMTEWLGKDEAEMMLLRRRAEGI